MGSITIHDGNGNENNCSAVEIFGIMESGEGVHTAAAMAMENSILLVTIAVAMWTSLNCQRLQNTVKI